MKTDSFKLKQECIGGYNATMQSPAMQKILSDAVAAYKQRQIDVEARCHKITELERELDQRTAAGEDVFINYWTLAVEEKQW